MQVVYPVVPQPVPYRHWVADSRRTAVLAVGLVGSPFPVGHHIAGSAGLERSWMPPVMPDGRTLRRYLDKCPMFPMASERVTPDLRRPRHEVDAGPTNPVASDRLVQPCAGCHPVGR